MFDILVDLLARGSFQSLKNIKVRIYAWLLRHTHPSYLYFRSDIHIYASSTLWQYRKLNSESKKVRPQIQRYLLLLCNSEPQPKNDNGKKKKYSFFQPLRFRFAPFFFFLVLCLSSRWRWDLSEFTKHEGPRCRD